MHVAHDGDGFICRFKANRNLQILGVGEMQARIEHALGRPVDQPLPHLAHQDEWDVVDVTDLGLLATNWQQGVSSPLSLSFDEAMALFPAFSAVSIPEPALGGLLVGLLPFLRRFRRV